MSQDRGVFASTSRHGHLLTTPEQVAGGYCVMNLRLEGGKEALLAQGIAGFGALWGEHG